jgi:hypothetical protein
MQTALKINSSELGNLAGYGAKFCSPREAAEKFWKRNRPDAFKEYVRNHGTPDWKKKDDFVYGNANAKQIMEESRKVKTENTGDIGGVLKSVSDDKRASAFTAEQKQYLEEATRTKVFQNHGTRKEGSTLDQWCRETGKNAFKPTDRYTLQIHPNVVVVGLIDGRTEDNELVELKNRAGGRLFNEVRSYEMAQCQAYLRMLDLKRGFLVECLRREGQEPKLNTIPFTRDDEFWEDTVERVLSNIFDPRFECFRVTESGPSAS